MLTISTATVEDIPALNALVNQAYRGEASKRGWTTEADLIAGYIRTNEANLLELMQKENAAILKCSDADGQIAGCVFVQKRDGRLYLGMLSVLPERQAEGIGKKLMQAATEHAVNSGCRSIFMQVISARIALVEWYERHGYVKTGESRPFDGDPQFGVPTQPLEFIILEKAVG